MLPERIATRYVTPLREGGSLPGLMEADDLGTYVVKFRAAGQGVKPLVAEIVCAHLARALGLPVPDLVLVELDPALAPGEPDEEVQDLLRASAGRNLGVDFLPGALDFDGAAFAAGPDAALAGPVLWFDAFVQNVDRSWRNPNMLHWHGRLWLIDHGAALTFQHDWSRAASSVGRPYDASEHALLPYGPDVATAAASLAPLVTDELLAAALAEVPDEWLAGPDFADAAAARAAYVARLRARLDATDAWLPPLAAVAREAAAGTLPAPRPRGTRPAWLQGRP